MLSRLSIGTVLGAVLLVVAIPGIAAADDPNFDPAAVEIDSINGEDPDQVNEFPVNISERIAIELTGLDEPDRPLMVEIGGEVVSSMDQPEAELRPRSGSDVTTGQQTLQIVYEDRGDRTIVAETEVDVTEVVLERPETDGGLDFDPESVEIETIDDQAVADVPELELTAHESISIGLSGTDAEDVYANVELDGTNIGSTKNGDSQFRPRQGSDISEGVQSFTLVREREGERIVIDETEVEVTQVDLTRDDPADLAFDPAAVTIASIDGQSADAIDLDLSYNETVSVSLDGIEVTNHALVVELSGTTIGSISESDRDFRPRTDESVETGEQTLTIKKRVSGSDDPVVAETTVTVTSVNLDRDADRDGMDVDPADVSLVSVDGESADQVNEIELTGESPLSLEIEGVEVPDRGFNIEIGGSVIGVLKENSADIRVRRDSDITTGEQKLTVVWESEGNRTVLAATEVDMTAVDLDRGESTVDPTEVDLEIVSVNGEAATGTVSTEYDLRGETPVEIEVAGLAETDLVPAMRYKEEFLSPKIDGYEVDGDHIRLAHLPRVNDGEPATLQLVKRTGAEEFHVFDSVTIEYRQVDGKTDLGGDGAASNSDQPGTDESGEQSGAGDETEGEATESAGSEVASDEGGGGGVLSGVMDAITGGGEDEETTEETDADLTDTEGTASEASTTADTAVEETDSEDEGGIFSFFRDLFGF